MEAGMDIGRAVQANLGYAKQLIGSGWDGIAEAPRKVNARTAWKPIALGAAAGMLASQVGPKRRSAGWAAAGAFVGLGAALAWASRKFLRDAARAAAARVNATRDAHWLELNPIDYA
jgi:hypothetical protein